MTKPVSGSRWPLVACVLAMMTLGAVGLKSSSDDLSFEDGNESTSPKLVRAIKPHDMRKQSVPVRCRPRPGDPIGLDRSQSA